MWLLVAFSCARPVGGLTPQAPVPSVGGSDLVCLDATGQAVHASNTGAVPAIPKAPAPLVELARAGDALVGMSADGGLYRLTGDTWTALAAASGAPASPQVLRARSTGDAAIFWIRGDDPGTVPGALQVSASGDPVWLDLSSAQQVASLWGVASVGASLAPLDPAPLREVVAQSGGAAAEDAPFEILFAEPSPWGGTLVGVMTGYDGDWPTGPLLWGDGGHWRVLTAGGGTVDISALRGYGMVDALLIDASSSSGPATLSLTEDGTVTNLPGLRRCAGR